MILPHPSVPLVSLGNKIDPAWYRRLSAAAEFVGAPAHHNSNGLKNQIAYDQNGFFYICVDKNSWRQFGPGNNTF